MSGAGFRRVASKTHDRAESLAWRGIAPDEVANGKPFASPRNTAIGGFPLVDRQPALAAGNAVANAQFAVALAIRGTAANSVRV